MIGQYARDLVLVGWSRVARLAPPADRRLWIAASSSHVLDRHAELIKRRSKPCIKRAAVDMPPVVLALWRRPFWEYVGIKLAPHHSPPNMLSVALTMALPKIVRCLQFSRFGPSPLSITTSIGMDGTAV